VSLSNKKQFFLMGLTYANIQLVNPFDEDQARRSNIGEDEIRQITVHALVDTGSIMLCINEDIQQVLQLPFRKKRRSQTADGRILELDVVGPVIVRYLDRECSTNAIILPNGQEALFGAIPMEEMDLYVNPARQELMPVHPDGPIMCLK
jgi:clan AA aspartic protease